MARRQASDHGAKRTQILQAAARVFAEQGIARASMAQVAQACGISKANIYHYYDGKDALLFDILDSYLSNLRDRICGLSLDGLGPEDKLRRIVAELLLAYEGMDHEHKIQSEGIPRLPAARQEVLKGYQREMVARLGGVLHAIAPRAFDGDPRRLRAATMSVFGMLNWFYMWNAQADRAERERYADLVARMTVHGVRGL